jgi:anti-anti-sigma regulatory factor
MFETRRLSKDEVVLAVDGPVTQENTAEFHRLMDELCSGPTMTVTLDLSKTPALNSSSLGKILLFRKKLAEGQRVLQIRGCSENLFQTFQMIRFDSLISIQR